MAEPGNWSDETYFGIGAVWGFVLGLAFSCEVFERVVAILAVTIGAALLGGFLGVALREDILDLILSLFF